VYRPKWSHNTLLRLGLVDEDRGTRIGKGDDAEGSSSQIVASQIVDSTQFQHRHEAYQPQYEQAHQQECETQDEAHEEQAMEFQVRTQGFSDRPTEFSLLLDFGKHVACRLWVDVGV